MTQDSRSINEDELTMSDLTIEEIDRAESRNLQLNLKLFPDEVGFYYQIRWLYENLFTLISDEFVPIGYLFKESGHCFMFGFQQVLRIHLVEAASSLRKAVESCAYAITIGIDPQKTRLWIMKDDDPKSFKQQIDMVKWQDPKTKQLKTLFDFLSNYSSHANLFGQAQRFILHGNHMTISYFDFDGEEPKFETRAKIMRQLNHVLNTHIKLLKLFGDLFDEVKKDKVEWDEKFQKVSDEFDQYKQSVRPILDSKYKKE